MPQLAGQNLAAIFNCQLPARSSRRHAAARLSAASPRTRMAHSTSNFRPYEYIVHRVATSCKFAQVQVASGITAEFALAMPRRRKAAEGATSKGAREPSTLPLEARDLSEADPYEVRMLPEQSRTHRQKIRRPSTSKVEQAAERDRLRTKTRRREEGGRRGGCGLGRRCRDATSIFPGVFFRPRR